MWRGCGAGVGVGRRGGGGSECRWMAVAVAIAVGDMVRVMIGWGMTWVISIGLDVDGLQELLVTVKIVEIGEYPDMALQRTAWLQHFVA